MVDRVEWWLVEFLTYVGRMWLIWAIERVRDQ